jgi:hypothetical protein
MINMFDMMFEIKDFWTDHRAFCRVAILAVCLFCFVLLLKA